MSSPPISGDQNKFDYPKATLLCRPNSHLFQVKTKEHLTFIGIVCNHLILFAFVSCIDIYIYN